jgi:hypothetical protein
MNELELLDTLLADKYENTETGVVRALREVLTGEVGGGDGEYDDSILDLRTLTKAVVMLTRAVVTMKRGALEKDCEVSDGISTDASVSASSSDCEFSELSDLDAEYSDMEVFSEDNNEDLEYLDAFGMDSMKNATANGKPAIVHPVPVNFTYSYKPMKRMQVKLPANFSRGERGNKTVNITNWTDLNASQLALKYNVPKNIIGPTLQSIRDFEKMQNRNFNESIRKSQEALELAKEKEKQYLDRRARGLEETPEVIKPEAKTMKSKSKTRSKTKTKTEKKSKKRRRTNDSASASSSTCIEKPSGTDVSRHPSEEEQIKEVKRVSTALQKMVGEVTAASKPTPTLVEERKPLAPAPASSSSSSSPSTSSSSSRFAYEVLPDGKYVCTTTGCSGANTFDRYIQLYKHKSDIHPGELL